MKMKISKKRYNIVRTENLTELKDLIASLVMVYSTFELNTVRKRDGSIKYFEIKTEIEGEK